MTDTLTICARAMWDENRRRCADALAKAEVDYELPAWEDDTEALREDWVAFARACLTALAENISEEMVEAGADATKDKLARWQVEQIVRSAIAAAKGEGQ